MKYQFVVNGMVLGIKDSVGKTSMCYIFNRRKNSYVCNEHTFIRQVSLASERLYAFGYVLGYARGIVC